MIKKFGTRVHGGFVTKVTLDDVLYNQNEIYELIEEQSEQISELEKSLKQLLALYEKETQ